MPTVFRHGPYRFFFYSNEGNEPVHIHVKAGEKSAKFWIDPLMEAYSFAFKPHERREVTAIIEANVDGIREAWAAHFDPTQGG